jgi:hypothetical protein
MICFSLILEEGALICGELLGKSIVEQFRSDADDGPPSNAPIGEE